MADDFVLCEVHCVRFDVFNKVPVVLLKDVEGDRFLPIWIGMFEATQIEIALEKVTVPRPMSHDLMKSILETFQLSAESVRIHDIIDGTFHAKIMVKNTSGANGNEPVEVDARPSDAIALSLRTDTPIYVARKIIDEAAIVGKVPDDDEMQKFKEFLADIKPGDFQD